MVHHLRFEHVARGEVVAQGRVRRLLSPEVRAAGAGAPVPAPVVTVVQGVVQQQQEGPPPALAPLRASLAGPPRCACPKPEAREGDGVAWTVSRSPPARGPWGVGGRRTQVGTCCPRSLWSPDGPRPHPAPAAGEPDFPEPQKRRTGTSPRAKGVLNPSSPSSRGRGNRRSEWRWGGCKRFLRPPFYSLTSK